MPQTTPAAVRRQIARGEAAPVYLLTGQDPHEQAAVAALFEELVEEELRPFNVERLHGGELRVDDLAAAARTLPVLSPKRVVIVLDADRLIAPKRESRVAEEEHERLVAFLKAPPAHAAVVFVAGALDNRRTAVKLLLRVAEVVDCGTIEERGDAERWIKARAAADGLVLEPGAVAALVDRCGLVLPALRAGIERLAVYTLGRPRITAADVREAVPAAPGEPADFGVAKAIWQNDASRALRELALAWESGARPEMLLGQLRAAAENLPPRRLKSAVEAVLRTDLALKSSHADPRILLERLVIELVRTPS